MVYIFVYVLYSTGQKFRNITIFNILKEASSYLIKNTEKK